MNQNEILEKIKFLKNNNILNYYSNLQHQISEDKTLKLLFEKISSLDTIIAEKSAKNIDCELEKERKKKLIDKLYSNMQYKEIVSEEKKNLKNWKELNKMLVD